MVIDNFEGEYRWLSNFWPCLVYLDGIGYPSVEHAYQAAKTFDVDSRFRIRDAKTPAMAKKLGKSVKSRKDWNEVKLAIMRQLLEQKFKKGTQLADYLASTNGVNLIEGNWWGDAYWGVCKGVGENHLGKLLMEIRNQNN